MNVGDNSLIGGLISTTTLALLTYGVNLWVRKSRKVERFIDGRPQILVRDGALFEAALSEAGITHAKPNGALRQNDCPLKDVHLAILETKGSISVLRHRETAA